MITTNQIYWIAGLLEGEGCFGLSYDNKYPNIKVGMVDLDTIEKARDIMCKSAKIIHEKRKQEWKDYFKFGIHGTKAIEWMMTLYPLMSNRRKNKIKQCLVGWKSQKMDRLPIARNSAKGRAVLSFM